ncbi:MAG TPA: hypothetical protein VHT91_32285 [Kofleriaceae bacterium]|jgi:hypothetical protein|nr:hypothetical protein [Kofleriaceae bacterium]
MAGPDHKDKRGDADKLKSPTDDLHDQTDERGPSEQRDQEAALRAAHIALAHDLPAQVLHVEVHGRMTRIAISAGHKRGVTVGMTGYVSSPHGAVAEFTIDKTEDGLAWADVELTPDTISSAGGSVIVNPAHSPLKKLPRNARGSVLRVSVEGGRSRIMMSNGYMQGVKYQMPGFVVDKHGRQLETFVVSDLGPNESVALVELTPDQLKDCEIVLNP